MLAAAQSEPSSTLAIVSDRPMVQNGAESAPDTPNSNLTPSAITTYPDGAAPSPLHHCTTPTILNDAARDTFASSAAISTPTPAPADTCIARQPCANPRDTSPDSTTTPTLTTTSAAQHDSPQAPDSARHVARELPGWDELTAEQVTALDLLAAGLPVARIAARLNVHRGTIHRWKTQHPAFMAALNRRHHDAHEALATHCTQLLTQAVDILQASLSRRRKLSPQRFRTALAILRTFGNRRLLLSPGPISSDSALRLLAVQRRIELHEPLKDPITYQELQRLRDELRHDFYDEHSSPLPPYDADPDAPPLASPTTPVGPAATS